MAIKTDFKVEGLKELTQTLTRELPAKTGATVVASTFRRSFRPMVKTAKQKAAAGPGSGALAQSIGMWRDRKVRGGRSGKTAVRMRIGPKRSNRKAILRYLTFYGKELSAKRINAGIRHGHFVEYGVPSRGISARPFLRPALDIHGKEGINNFADLFGKEIDKALSKKSFKRRSR